MLGYIPPKLIDTGKATPSSDVFSFGALLLEVACGRKPVDPSKDTDILVYSKLEEEHEQHLRMVLQVLQEHHLYAKLSKCSFYEEQIHYLGHIISKEGIVVDPEKIEAIREWSAPKNVHKSDPLWV
jgi:serine/threonine protein kinase